MQAQLAVSPYSRAVLVGVTHPFRTKHSGRAARIVVTDVLVYASLVLAIHHIAITSVRAFLAVIAGVFTARLFIIGHDACHGSFLSNARMNRIVARLVFLPSLTPYSLWELGHNVAHHGFPNLKGRDYVWTPFSKDEFDALAQWRKWLEKIYRSGLI